MELKKETKVTHYVDYGDLERFLTEKLGKDVEVIGSNNDTDYKVTVKPLDESSSMYQYDLDEEENFAKTGYIDCEVYELGPALQYAARQGWIEYGNYVVTVSW